MCSHDHPDYYAFDILSDLLSNGRSSRLNQHLVQQKQLFSSIDAYISGSVDAGLFHISGKPSAGVSLEQAEAAVREELLGRAEDMEKEVDRYRAVTAGQLQRVAQSAFRQENGVILYYKKQVS